MVKATRIIQPHTIKPGETVSVTVEITDNIGGTVTLHEIPLIGWKTEQGLTNVVEFKESTNEWIWLHHTRPKHGYSTLAPIMTASYTLIAPQDIPAGKYQIAGTVMHADGELTNVSGDYEITVINDKSPVLPVVLKGTPILPETAPLI